MGRRRQGDGRERCARLCRAAVPFTHALAFLVLASLITAFLHVASADAAARVFRAGSGESAGRFIVPIGKSETLRVDQDFNQVVIGDSTIADVVPLSSRSAYVLGKKIGTTNLSVYDAQKQLIAVIDIEISFDIDALGARFREAIPGSHIRITTINGRVLLSGTVPNGGARKTALMIAEQFAPDSVSSALKIGTPQQVMLEVRFVEASHQASRELGLKWDVISKRFTSQIGLDTLATNSTPFGVIIGRLLNNGATADLIIRALEEKGLARRLAEPNLVALSGDTASFLAGGEFPFPVQAEGDRITVEFKKFGVGLAFTPTVLSGGLINLKIEPEVSQLDPNNALRVNNIEIPSLIVRRARTTVELRDGQSFAIAGLLQTDNTKQQQQIPWIGSVPVLGALFRSASYLKNQTDLVIIITPRLVQPVPPGKRLATPHDNTAPTNDPQFFLTGRQEMRKDLNQFMETGGSMTGPYGHILESKPARRN